jgi:hypothetical protein
MQGVMELQVRIMPEISSSVIAPRESNQEYQALDLQEEIPLTNPCCWNHRKIFSKIAITGFTKIAISY